MGIAPAEPTSGDAEHAPPAAPAHCPREAFFAGPTGVTAAFTDSWKGNRRRTASDTTWFFELQNILTHIKKELN